MTPSIALPKGPSDQRKAIEEEIFTLVDRHFREVLKPFLLAKFGAAAGEGGAARFTAMMNDFFTKVLEKRPDEFWRAKSATELRKWASVVVSNQMRDYLRREKLRNFDSIAPLVEERQRLLQGEDRHGPHDQGSRPHRLPGAIARTKTRRLQGWALRHRFVDGMTRDQIGDQLNRKRPRPSARPSTTGIAALAKALDD